VQKNHNLCVIRKYTNQPLWISKRHLRHRYRCLSLLLFLPRNVSRDYNQPIRIQRSAGAPWSAYDDVTM